MAAHSTQSERRRPDGNIRYYERLADNYDLFFRDYERSAAEEGAWLDGILGGAGARAVLDASCGTGRQAIPLAQRGYQVEAADPSAGMLERARRDATAADVHIQFFALPFAQLPAALGRQYDAVIALGNGLCNQERPESVQESLRALRRCCRSGGLCLVGIKDFATLRTHYEPFHGHRVAEEDGKRTILFEIWDIEQPVLVSTAFLIEEDGKDGWDTVSATTREYMLEAEELEIMALSAGFTAVERLDHPSEAVFLLRG